MPIFKICRLSLLALPLFFYQIVNAEKLENYTNAIGMKFVCVPAGKFVMGEILPVQKARATSIQPMRSPLVRLFI